MQEKGSIHNTLLSVYHTLTLTLCLQTSIIVEFKPMEGSKYQVQWKQYPESWEDNTKHKSVADSQSKVEIEGLEPGTTYCLRLIVCDASERQLGAPGKELILDTEQVGCTPKPDKSCCVVL